MDGDDVGKCPMRAAAPARAAPARPAPARRATPPTTRPPGRGRTSSGGRTSSTSRSCTSTRSTPIRSRRSSTTSEAFKTLDLAAVKQDLFALMTTDPGMVAGRSRPLRPAADPHGLAQRRHLPRRRRPRRCGLRHAALRAAELLARQRQPRQGPPAAVAGQAEVRPQDLLGRPDGAGRQLRPGVDGPQDLRLRRRPRRRVGARGGHQLGPRGHLARRQPLQRRPRAVRSPGRGADGADLRQP